MVGLAARLVVADRVRSQWPAGDRGVLDAHPTWYALGALGPALGDFVPSTVPATFGAPGRTPYWGVWKEVLTIAVGDSTTGSPGIVPVLRTMRELLARVAAAVADQDQFELRDIRDSGAAGVIDKATADLGVLLQQFSDPDRLKLLGSLMGSRSRPRIGDPAMLFPPGVWTGRDWLHGRGTGRFAVALRQRAEASGDARLIAYSRGWQVAYTTLVAGTGYVNSAVGSCYRTHWWRHRWVSNFVDTWLWGFYGTGAAMAGDTPSPGYESWVSLCDAGLHRRIDVTGGGLDAEAIARAMASDGQLPQLLPAEFVDYWLSAFQDAYGTDGTVPFDAAALQNAYAALVTVLWFQTSGDVIGCNPPPGPAPEACGDGDPPDWTDPTQINPATGKPFQPVPPSPEGEPDIAQLVSGIALALAGIFTAVFGGWALGAAGLIAGIGLALDGATDLDWDDLECDLHWLDVYLFNGLTALHNLTVLGGVQHPYPRDLAVDSLVLSFGGNALPYTSGAAVAKSQGIEGLRQPWSGLLSSWTGPPSEEHEAPFTDVWGRPGLWPSAIVDDDAANPATHDVQDPPPNPWPGGMDEYVGPAVPAALRVVAEDRAELPDWNLDGDRGRGWLCWQLDAPYAVPVNPVPEA